MRIFKHFLTAIVVALLLGGGVLSLTAAIHPDPKAMAGWVFSGQLSPVGDAIFDWAAGLSRALPVLEYIGIGSLVIGGICLGHWIACQLLRPAPIARTPDGLPDPDARRPSMGVPPWLVTIAGVALLGFGGKLYGDYRVAMANDFGAPKVVAEATAQFEAARSATEAEETPAVSTGGPAPVPTPRTTPAPTAAAETVEGSGFVPTVESFEAARQPVMALGAVTVFGAFLFGFSIGQRRMRYQFAMGDGSLADVQAAELLARRAETGKGMENYAGQIPGLKIGDREGNYNAREKRAEIIRKLEARMPDDSRGRRKRRATA
ncbi:MAG: hypothetical protein AAF899_00355 [Pseudomonadota bacterium]